MAKKTIQDLVLTLFSVFLLTACAATPTGRSQLSFFSPEQMARMGETAYKKIKHNMPESQNPAINRYVRCVAEALTAVAPPPPSGTGWEVTVFKADQTINAFALPGGNIGIYTGLLKVTENAAQLATVIGHEIGHVIAQHSNARLSTRYATRAGLQLIRVLAGATGNPLGQQVMALLGLGARVGIILPYSRAQESEADILGLRYMAQAGFDPRQSVQLWKNMAQIGGPTPPVFLSTHPSDISRIHNLKQHLPKVMDTYRQALAAGRQPECRLPKGILKDTGT